MIQNQTSPGFRFLEVASLAMLFSIAMDGVYIISQTTENRRQGTCWTLSTLRYYLDDVNYDNTFLSQSHNDIQEKPDRLARFTQQVRLKANAKKLKSCLRTSQHHCLLRLNC